MAPKRLCAVLGMILCATAGCARPPGQEGTPLDQKGITATALPPLSDPPPTGPTKVLPDNRAIDLRPQTWTRYDIMDGNQIRIYYTILGLPQCNVLGKVEAAESPARVTITLHVGQMPDASCAARVLKAAEVFTDVELAAPLGGRTVTDGSK